MRRQGIKGRIGEAGDVSCRLVLVPSALEVTRAVDAFLPGKARVGATKVRSPE